MEIGINARTFAVEEPAGPAQTAIEVTKRLRDGDDNLTLFGASELQARFPETDLCHSYFYNNQPYGLVWEQFVPPLKSKTLGLDVLYCPNGNSPVYEIATPVVVCIHDIMNYLGLSNRPYQLLQQFRVPRVVKAADAVITVSKFSKEELTAHIDVDPEKVKVVHNGVFDIFLNASDGEAFDLPDDYILYVGGYHERKNIGTLIDVYQTLRDQHAIDEKLVLIGPDPTLAYSSPDLDMQQLEVDSDIVMKGYVTQEQLKYAYKHASLFLFLSEYEGFGLPPLEAMACGTPVVSSNKASMPEILGDVPVYVDPNDNQHVVDAVSGVLKRRKKEAELQPSGQERSAQFTWDRAVKETKSVLEEVSQT